MSLINIDTEHVTRHVRFVSYTGRYPNLCSGVLTLEIVGAEHRFGHGSGQHEKFWRTGGACGFHGRRNGTYVRRDEWVIDVSLLPEELKCYATEINAVFNSNVEHGCCGGCI